MRKPPVSLFGRKKSHPSNFNIWVLSGAIGWRIAMPVVLFVFIGIKIDKWLHTLPFFTLAAMFLAFATSIVLIKRDLYNLLVSNSSKEEDSK